MKETTNETPNTWYDPDTGETLTDTELREREDAIVADAEAQLALGHVDCWHAGLAEAQNLLDRFATPIDQP